MSMSDMEFRAVLLDQMKDYLDGRITKEEYYDQAEPFYTEYANTYENPLFHKCFMDTVPEACLFYIDEPGLTSEIKESKFHEALQEAYVTLEKL